MLLIFDNLVEPTKGVHGVVVTHLLAKEELRVRFSLDALQLSGCGKAWLLRVLREHEIVGSNPTILTEYSGVANLVRRLPVKEINVGSNPTAGAFSNVPLAERQRFLQVAGKSYVVQRLVPQRSRSWSNVKKLPIRSGRFDSDMALFFTNDIRVSANGKPAAFEAVV